MRRIPEYPLALLLDLVGAGGALLIGARTWQVVRTPRPSPLPPDVLPLTGRTVDGAATALALVALAGVVAVVATRGVLRRAVGVVLAAAGAGLVWQALAASQPIGASHARALVREHHPSVPTDSHVAPLVAASSSWPGLTAACGALVAVAGVLVALRGHRWATLSARYDNRSAAEDRRGAVEAHREAEAAEQPPADDVQPPVGDDSEAAQAARARAVTSMWNALDRGDDPTDQPGK